jgi:hypothetical protein
VAMRPLLGRQPAGWDASPAVAGDGLRVVGLLGHLNELVALAKQVDPTAHRAIVAMPSFVVVDGRLTNGRRLGAATPLPLPRPCQPEL